MKQQQPNNIVMKKAQKQLASCIHEMKTAKDSRGIEKYFMAAKQAIESIKEACLWELQVRNQRIDV